MAIAVQRVLFSMSYNPYRSDPEDEPLIITKSANEACTYFEIACKLGRGDVEGAPSFDLRDLVPKSAIDRDWSVQTH